MFGQNWRLPHVILACFLSLALAYGGQYLYRHFIWERALKQSLQRIPEVQSVVLKDGRNTVEVELGATPDLKQTYMRVEDALQPFYRGQVPRIALRGRPSDELLKVWEESQFAVYEAAVRGTFTAMAQEVKRTSNAYGVDARLDMDGYRIYVALYKDPYFFYEVVPLENPLGASEEGVS